MAIDLTDENVQSGGSGEFEPLPRDRYELQIESVTLGAASTGTTCLKTKSKVVSDKYNGRYAFIDLYITPNALWRLKEFLLACDYSKARQVIEEQEIADDLTKLKPTFSAYAEVDGKYNKWKEFVPVGANAPATAETKDDDLPF